MRQYVLLLVLLVVMGCDESLTNEPSKKKSLGLGLRSPIDAVEAEQLQEQTAWELRIPIEKNVSLCQNVDLNLILIPPGQFHMGSPESEYLRDLDEGPLHLVKITKPFYMGKYEITQLQYKLITGKSKECKFIGDYLPVENINLYEVKHFLRALYGGTGLYFRLPTEAEWEYACRAGTDTPFYTGKTISPDEANYDGRYVYGRGHRGAYLKKTVNVGSYPPNPFGLCDMHGNVWEWCLDSYSADYYSNSPVNDPRVSLKKGPLVIRGGAFNCDPDMIRSAKRKGRGPGADKKYLGFRVVLDIPDSLTINEKSFSFAPPTGKRGAGFTTSNGSSEDTILGVQSSKYYNSSIIVCVSFDKSDSKSDSQSIVETIQASGMFDSVKLFHETTYLNHAKTYGYRYMLVSNADETYTLYDLLLKKNESIQFLENNSNVIFVIEQTVSKFEKTKSSNNLVKKYVPVEEELVYDEATRRGYISVKGKGLSARSWMLKKIGEVCSSKNIVIQAGIRPEPGYFRVLDEKLQDGKFTIEFEAIR